MSYAQTCNIFRKKGLAERGKVTMSMNDADKYRAYARQCIGAAERTFRHEQKLMLLEMAQTWLGMIPEPQRTSADDFQTAVRKRGTGQEPSRSQH